MLVASVRFASTTSACAGESPLLQRVDLDVPRRVGRRGPNAQAVRAGAVGHVVRLQRTGRVGDEAPLAEEIAVACPGELRGSIGAVSRGEPVADAPLPSDGERNALVRIRARSGED